MGIDFTFLPKVNKCCCGCSLRVGSILIAIYVLFSTISNSITYLSVECLNSPEWLHALYRVFGIIIYILVALLSFSALAFFVFGILLPHILSFNIFIISFIAYELGVFIFAVTYTAAFIVAQCCTRIYFIGTVIDVVWPIILYISFFLILHIYFIIVLNSYKQEVFE